MMTLNTTCLLKRIALLLVLPVFLGLSSCLREENPVVDEKGQEIIVADNEALLSFTVDSPVDAEMTKSVISDANFESGIRTLLVLIVGEDGSWKKSYKAASAPSWLSAGVGNGVTMSDVRVRADYQAYGIYVFANMGDIEASIPRDASGRILPESYVYALPDSYTEFNTTGMPMCASTTISASALKPYRSVGTHEVNLTLRRLMSKVNITVNKSGMLTGASDGSALAGGSLKLRQVSKVLRPFAAEADRRAQSASEMYSADTDWHNFTGGSGKDVIDSGVTLYIPENRQGTGSGPTQAGKTPASGREALATYLEYTATKSGSSDGVSGNLTYKAYLGENELNDFNVIGDKVYTATLSLSWGGMWEGSWRVSQGDWADTRALVISAAAGSTVKMDTKNTKAESAKVRKSTPTAFYMNYFLDGAQASTIQHGRKDLSSWPYGWEVLVDGKTANMNGSSGTIKNSANVPIISWSYDSATDCLSMEAIAGAPANTDIHTLQFRTLDGRKQSNVVYFTTSIPFEFRWEADTAPNHVAQRGILYAIDSDTNAQSADGKFHLKSGYASKVRMTDRGDGSAVVELIDGFSSIADAIYIEDSDGDRHCDVPLEARVPWFECSDLWLTYVDASQNLKFTYYAVDENGNASTTPMTLSSTQGSGNYLDQALVLECIPPSCTSQNNKLGFTHSVVNGTMLINTYIKTYKGLSPSGNSFRVDEARIGMAKSSQAVHNTEFWAWNPWKNISRIENGKIMNDFTLYKVPAQSSPYTGWYTYTASSPAYLTDYRPVESSNYTMDLQNAVIANPKNLTFDMEFKDITGKPRLGNICTGNPGKTAADYNASAYSLFLDITDQSNYDKQRIYEYLYARGFQFVNIDDMNSQIAQYDYTFVIGSAYATVDAAWQNAPSGVSASTPSSIQGTKFRVVANSAFSTWTMTYGMKGKTEDDIKVHGAGELSIYMQVHNAYDDSYLERQVGKAWMRLHAYIWGEVSFYNAETFGTSVKWLTGGDPNMNALPAILRYKSPLSAHANNTGTDASAQMNSMSSQSIAWCSPTRDPGVVWDTPTVSKQSRDKFVDFIRNCEQPWYFDFSNISDANKSSKYYITSEGGVAGGLLYYDPTATSSGGTFTRDSDVAPYNTQNTRKLYVFHIGQVSYTTMNWDKSYNLGFYMANGWR